MLSRCAVVNNYVCYTFSFFYVCTAFSLSPPLASPPSQGRLTAYRDLTGVDLLQEYREGGGDATRSFRLAAPQAGGVRASFRAFRGLQKSPASCGTALAAAESHPLHGRHLQLPAVKPVSVAASSAESTRSAAPALLLTLEATGSPVRPAGNVQQALPQLPAIGGRSSSSRMSSRQQGSGAVSRRSQAEAPVTPRV
jgi:hypothetical protein